MARELGRLREQAQQRTAVGEGAGEGTLEARWAWLSLAAMIVPIIGLVLAIVIT
jgi:hypothetical protein